jgi:hypothetical protein
VEVNSTGGQGSRRAVEPSGGGGFTLHAFIDYKYCILALIIVSFISQSSIV